jgi:glycosyltransferase involved in cell wall biosynthesis
MIKVLIAHSSGIGGTKVVADKIASYLSKLGYECEQLILPTNFFKNRVFLRFPFSILDAWLNFYEIRRKSKQISKYDLIITLQPHSLYLKHRRMLIVFQHQFKPAYELLSYYLANKKFLKKIVHVINALNRRIIDRIALQWIKRFPILAISKTVNERLKKFWGISANRIIYPGGYDGEIESFGNEYVLYLGRLNWNVKRLKLVYEAAKLLPNIPFVVAGDPDPPPKEAQNPPKNIRLIAHNSMFSTKEKQELYSRAFCVIYPAKDEDYGLVPIEAMAAGKPCIVCNDGGGVTETIIHKKTGLIVPPNPIAIANAILELRNTSNSYREECLQRARLFSWNTFLNEVERIIKEMCFKP